jgi:AAA ATPase domain
MFHSVRAEVLARDWLPPVVLGRRREVEEVVRRLDPPHPQAPPPWIVGVSGPSGSGTSAVARRAAREVSDRLRATSTGPLPRLLALRVAGLRGPHGVASALVQRWDDGFDGRGFPVPEILAGFLRRVRRDARPVVLVLDDVSIGAPDLAPILRAIGDPDRFLPEGECGLPPFWTVVAGTPEGLAPLANALRGRFPFGPFVTLRPYDPPLLRSIVSDRVERAVGQPAHDDFVARIVTRTVEENGGSRRAIELVRRELLGHLSESPSRPRSGPVGLGVAVETRVVRAIGAASCGVAARLGDVKRFEAELAREQGRRPLPATTLWRRILRLEQAGYVRREIRTGGCGGTRSLVRVLTPIDEWVTDPHPRDTRPDDVPWSGPSSDWVGDPPEPARPSWEPPPNEDGAG